MKSTTFLVIAHLLCVFGGAQEYDLHERYTFSLEQQPLHNVYGNRLLRSIESKLPLNESNLFQVAKQGAFPNCQIYGRTYCTDIEGYPE